MTSTTKLTSKSLADLYTVPASDWTAVNKRVGLVVSAQQIEKTVAKYLPHFDDLMTACQDWKQETFNDIITSAGILNSSATDSAKEFGLLLTNMQGLTPGVTDLPEGTKAIATKVIGAVNDATQKNLKLFSALSGNINAFKIANNNVDQDVKVYKQKLGPLWNSISQSMLGVDNATGKVLGEWQGIADDLNNVVTNKVEITLPFLMGLEIQSAIDTWKMIATETSAFASMAAGQKQYLTGGWTT